MKITYYLGAGASCNAIPIWKDQAISMTEVAEDVLQILDLPEFHIYKEHELSNNQELKTFFNSLKTFGQLACEYGSIDIYAKRLFLLNEGKELNKLKFCLSVYFDLWEHGLVRPKKSEHSKYDEIDKRYFSLLSVLLEKGKNTPELNENISFISWNYDLQVERSYESFLEYKPNNLIGLNNTFNFMGSSLSKRKHIVHLNGYRGLFKYKNDYYDNVENNDKTKLYSYLEKILDNCKSFNQSKLNYNECIKYAWEGNSKAIEDAKGIMAETDILIIIGYSFPAFNRKLDWELINEFENNKKRNKKVIYQDPNANEDIVNYLFRNAKIVQYERKNTGQFYIPHEFLAPSSSSGKFLVF